MTSIVSVDFYKEGFNKLSSSITGLYQRVRGKSQKDALARLREWLTKIASENKSPDDFVSWLTSLSDKEIEALNKKLASFGNYLNFELDWLLSSELENDPQIRQALSEVVLFHSLALWKASQVQDDIEAFVILRDWQKNPLKRGHETLNQQLFAELVKQGLASTPPPELFLATEKERQAFIIDNIEQAISNDKQAVSALLKELKASEQAQEEAPMKALPGPPAEEAKPKRERKSGSASKSEDIAE
jgi:hypothetical protein